MPERRLGLSRWALIFGLSVLTLTVGLGRSGRLTYHEAFVAQAAREISARGNWIVPTIGGFPWLEKPPLAFWLVALAGKVSGGITEGVARFPSAVAGLLLVVGIATFAGRRFGPAVGLLTGLIQATTAWTVMRGRLAEVDIVLACLITWTFVAFDRLRGPGKAAVSCAIDGHQQKGQLHQSRLEATQSSPLPSLGTGGEKVGHEQRDGGDVRLWRWLFFGLLGLSALAKGVGFGAVLIGSVVAVITLWDRDVRLFQRLRFARGWMLAAILGLTWPLLVAVRHPSVLGLWALHVTDRLAAKPEYFIGTPWWQFAIVVLGQLLPWAPLTAVGAYRTLGCAITGRGGGDRFLLVWFTVPLLLLSLATVKSPHYAIHALPPCSVWAAISLARLGQRLQLRGWSPGRVQRLTWACFVGLGSACTLGYTMLGPQFDRRGVEWGFYQTASGLLRANEPLVLLYNVPDWDRTPYPSPFGPVPHDAAVRLYYLEHPARWCFGADELAKEATVRGKPFAAIGRDCDIPALQLMGTVKTVAQGPSTRHDRIYRLFRITPRGAEGQAGDKHRLTQIGGKWKD